MPHFLSLGFDDERPYGNLAETQVGKDFLNRKIDFLGRMNEAFDAAAIPRTHFLLGAYIEAARSSLGEEVLQAMYPATNPLLDLQQHSHSHGVYEPLAGVEKNPMTAEQYIADIWRASDVIEAVIGVRPQGLRTPYGYDHDLSGRSDILGGLRHAGIHFVSSDLGSKQTLAGEMTAERQPHSYAREGFPDIVEVPAHGLQDVVYTREKAQQLFNQDKPPSSEEAFQQYDAVLGRALQLNAEKISVALCLHPWAVMEYDPKLELLLRIVERAREKGFQILHYRAVANGFRDTAATD